MLDLSGVAGQTGAGGGESQEMKRGRSTGDLGHQFTKNGAGEVLEPMAMPSATARSRARFT